MKTFNNLMVNAIGVMLCFNFRLSFGYQQMNGSQVIYFNENDEANVMVTFEKLKKNVTPKLFYANHTESDLKFKITLDKKIKASLLYTFYKDGDMNKESLVLRFFLRQDKNSNEKHPCLKQEGCEIIVSEWYSKKRKLFEKQTVEYNKDDAISMLITVEDPPNVVKRILRVASSTQPELGKLILHSVNRTIRYQGLLTEDLDRKSLYLEGYDRNNKSVYSETLIKYRYLRDFWLPYKGRSPCLSFCELEIVVHNNDKNYNEIDDNVTDKNEKDNEKIDNNKTDKNEKGSQNANKNEETINKNISDKNTKVDTEINKNVTDKDEKGGGEMDKNVSDKNMKDAPKQAMSDSSAIIRIIGLNHSKIIKQDKESIEYEYYEGEEISWYCHFQERYSKYRLITYWEIEKYAVDNKKKESSEYVLTSNITRVLNEHNRFKAFTCHLEENVVNDPRPHIKRTVYLVKKIRVALVDCRGKAIV